MKSLLAASALALTFTMCAPVHAVEYNENQLNDFEMCENYTAAVITTYTSRIVFGSVGLFDSRAAQTHLSKEYRYDDTKAEMFTQDQKDYIIRLAWSFPIFNNGYAQRLFLDEAVSNIMTRCLNNEIPGYL